MTERTKKQAIAKHLCRVMGKDDAIIACGWWQPHHDRAQCMEVIEWAAVNGLGPTLEDTYCAAFNDQVKQFKASHDNTPAGVRAAALEAIALATGFEEN